PVAAASPVASPVAAASRAAQPAAAFRPGPIAGAPPTRQVEYVISTNPGGGSDIYARFMIGVIEKYSLSPQPFLPINRDGGAGAVAMQYVAAKQGDPHAVMITLNSFITTPMLQKLPFTSDTFTPVALLGLDSFFLWVPAESPFKTFGDFLTAAKEREIAVAGTGSKQEDEILFKLIEMRGGTKPFRYVPFRGGGEVCTALAGNQVEATVNNPSECLSFHPDKVRPLAAFLDNRSPAFRDLPTAKELGLDISYSNMRAVVAAPGISREQQQWHEGLFKQVYDSPDWQDFLQKNALDAQFLAGDQFKKFLDDFEALHKDLIERAGWAE
ncbi:MAG: tripartite tricarboxylate transporter substrate binding protein, partial [Chloroflexi bacterium]|nr:tripartite tricarboxylate transporter substrate binding protein [Chloroflexota bacterium]